MEYNPGKKKFISLHLVTYSQKYFLLYQLHGAIQIVVCT